MPEQPARPVDVADGGEPERERGEFGQLDEALLGDETLVAYAAAAAAAGTGRNSPYTSALLAHLDEPLEILTLFRRVRARVLEATNGEQRPHEYQSLLREHYLSGAPAVEAVTVEAAAPDVIDVDVTELDVAQLRVLAERSEAVAQSELGRRYEAGRDGVERDYGETVSWYRRAAEQGHSHGKPASASCTAAVAGSRESWTSFSTWRASWPSCGAPRPGRSREAVEVNFTLSIMNPGRDLRASFPLLRPRASDVEPEPGRGRSWCRWRCHSASGCSSRRSSR